MTGWRRPVTGGVISPRRDSEVAVTNDYGRGAGARAWLAISWALSAKDIGRAVVPGGELLLRLGQRSLAKRGRDAAFGEPAHQDAGLGDSGGGLGLGLDALEPGLAADELGLGLLERVLKQRQALLEPPVLLTDAASAPRRPRPGRSPRRPAAAVLSGGRPSADHSARIAASRAAGPEPVSA